MTFHPQQTAFKAINLTLIYALSLNILLPGVTAYGQLLHPALSAAAGPDLAVNDQRETEVPAVAEVVLTDTPTEAPLNELPEAVVAMASPVTAVAASQGGQAESSGFSLNSAENLVDPFTGDFNYSIPLMDVEGYPITLSYNSNVSMNSEASWVGLGWNLNVGSVSREMRGIPDEFNGDQKIVRTVHQKDDETLDGMKKGGYAYFGVSFPIEPFYAQAGLSAAFLKGHYTNSYLGYGKTIDLSLGRDVGVGLKVYDYGQATVGASGGVSLSYDTRRGLNMGFGGGLNAGISAFTFGASAGTYTMSNFNSRAGLTGKTTTRSWSFDAAVYGMSNAATSTVTYGSITSVPRLELNSKEKSRSFTIDRFLSFNFGLMITAGTMRNFYASRSTQITDEQTVYQPALGYFHSGKKIASSKTSLPVMDYNRSNDTKFSDAMTNLPFSMQTFDVFYTNAMGMQGTFRGLRTDVGTYVDGTTTATTTGVDQTDKQGIILFPPGYTSEMGVGLTMGQTTSGELEAPNSLNVFEFSPLVNAQNGFDKAVYFKGIGEATETDASVYNNLGGMNASRPVFGLTQFGATLSRVINIPGTGSSFTVPSSGQLVQADAVAATVFRPLTVKELVASPKTADHSYATFPTTGSYTPTAIFRNTRADNLLSKVEVISTDGTYYGYGIPNYSNEQSEVAFMIGSSSTSAPPVTPNADGTVNYDPGIDNSVINSKGIANYYDKTKLPAYAESFLLTEMLSADYIDRTGNGPSLDDIGNYYQFNYTKAYDNYEWRFPIGANKAFYMEGTMGSQQDDLATYSYGKKEIWYSHSVESKNMIAEFILVDREDAYGVNENGTLTGQKLKALKKIVLYNKSERKGPSGATAKPLQTIEFFYTYDLCPGYPGNPNTAGLGSGKLTLTSIRVSSGSSSEMAASPYVFAYGTGASNPPFNYANVDAWGNYKPSDVNKPNKYAPYAEQNEGVATANSKAWKLISVQSPTHGVMAVDYEADRYSYVQDKRAMKHVRLNSVTNLFELMAMKYYNALNLTRTYNTFSVDEATISFPVGSLFVPYLNYYEEFGPFNPKAIPNNVIVFKLERPIPVTDTDADLRVKNDYFTDGSALMRELLVKLHVKVNASEAYQELVPVFCTISHDLTDPFNNFHVFPDDLKAIGVLPPAGSETNYTYGYVIVDPVIVENPKLDLFSGKVIPVSENGNESFSPFQRACNDFFQRSLSEIVYTNSGFNSGAMLDFMAGARMDLNKAMRAIGYAPGMVMIAQDIDGDGANDASYLNSLRLYIPNNVKFGGNARVKSIKYYDNWNAISGEYSSSYEWLYQYDFGSASSGVASYESRASRDESAFYMWDSYFDKREKFPDVFNYTPTPAMELLFPTGVVGYSKTATKFNGDSERGYAISEFYTAKDRPTAVSTTNIGKQRVAKVSKSQGSTVYNCGFSQGFSIETNDFHGKPKQTIIMKGDPASGSAEILSRSTYHYYGLNEPVKLVDRQGNITEQLVGAEYDLHADSRMVRNIFASHYIGFERYYGIMPPFFKNTINKRKSYYTTAFYAHAFIKHANRSAVLKDIETEYMGSVKNATNLVFDKYSGNPVLSSLTDEYGDQLYSVNYPAHWYYREMREITGRQGASVPIVLASGAVINSAATYELLTPGDVIQFPGGQKAWVAKHYPWPTSFALHLIDANGNQFTALPAGSYTVRIVSTNRANMLNATMQSVTTKEAPTIGATLAFPATKILSAAAITFRDRLSALCAAPGELNNNAVRPGSVNPYLFGLRGDLVLNNQLSWQSERVQQTEAHGVRLDGAYTSYIPYYAQAGDNNWYPLNHPSHPSTDVTLALWRKAGEVTEFDQYGKPSESKDPLGIYSGVLYGYNNRLNLLPVAQAVNTRQQEIAFDGFEDYNYFSDVPMTSYPSHFDFKPALLSTHVTIEQGVRHSGLSSLKITSGHLAKVKRFITVPCDPATSHTDPGLNSIVDTCDCIQPFSPTPGKYVVGAWIRQFNESGGGIRIKLLAADNSVLLNTVYYATGSSLDGWQRIEGTFVIPSNAASIEVSAENFNEATINFDDIRLHPYLAGMSTVVYDPKTLLKLASHDGYNYTTFYNYDENMQLVRVRVETAEGIKTITESEMSIYKY